MKQNLERKTKQQDRHFVNLLTEIRLNEKEGTQRTFIAYSPDGLHLASASGDKTVRIWEVPKGGEVGARRGHSRTIYSVAHSSDGRHLASTSEDKTVRIWTVKTGTDTQTRVWPHSAGAVWEQVSFSSDSSSLILGSGYETLHLDVATLDEISTPAFISPLHSPAPQPFCLFLDGNSLCAKQGAVTLRICWLPDYFKPSTAIVQHGGCVSIGGEGGELAVISLYATM